MSEAAQKVLVVLGCIAIAVACIFAVVVQQRQWQQYATEHHCVSVGTKAGQYVYTAKGGGWTADQTIYRCDNGEEQIR